MSKPVLFLIDANGLCYRAYYAVKGLVNSKGQATNAVFGFTNILRKILSDFKPTHVAACFDAGKQTHRTTQFADYKAKRQSMPDDLVTQLPLIKEVLKGYRISILEQEGYEADDIMATLARRYSSQGMDIVIVSEDKDMGQLVGPQVRLYSSRQEKFLDTKDIEEKFGVRPNQITDYLGLAGDASDNIPGVEGVGDVSARKLLSQFNTIEEMYAHVDQIASPKLVSKLLDSKEKAFLSKSLATLHDDLTLDCTMESLATQEPNQEALVALFNELEFRKLAQTFQSSSEDEAPVAQEDIAITRHVMVNTSAGRVNVVYGYKELLYQGITFQGPIFDVQLAGYLLAGGVGGFDAASLCWKYLNKAPYVACLADLYQPLKDLIDAQAMTRLLQEIEIPLSDVLWRMEQSGVFLDRDVLQKLSQNAAVKIKDLEKSLYTNAGVEFNLNSPKQLSQILFEKLKLPVVKKTKTGFSTDEEVLHTLSSQHPLPALILEYRQIAKLKSTYIDALPVLMDDKGLVHASFNQMGADTGRLSSNNPNLQNIPIRTDLGRQIRQAFTTSDPTHVLFAADYSQIELRILAHLSGDPSLRQAFESGGDIHRYTASLMFDVSEEKVDDQMRYAAKRINFGIIYGMSAFGLAKDLSLSQRQAQEFIDRYFLRYPKVQSFMDAKIEEAKELGYVSTLFGRRRYLPDIHNRNMGIRQFAQRQAINTPVQGTAADLIKLAMVAIDQAMAKSSWKARMIMTVHDELVFDVPKVELAPLAVLVREHMEHAIELTVPLKTSLKSGSNWMEMESL